MSEIIYNLEKKAPTTEKVKSVHGEFPGKRKKKSA